MYVCIRASKRDFGTYHIEKLWRLRQACADAQSRRSPHFSHIQSIEVEEGYEQKLDLSYDVPSGIEITQCIKIDKPLVVYRCSGNVIK